jgi:hypothetical protein
VNRLIALGFVLLLSTVTRRSTAQVSLVPDRTAVRYFAAETGGPAHPRFLTAREVAFFTRIEALIEKVPDFGDDYPERYVRAAIDRLVARALLAALLAKAAGEPSDLPRLTLEARAELVDRVGAAALDHAKQREGIDETELLSFLSDAVRATFYLDRAVTPLTTITDDVLRQTYRSASHPFRAAKFEDIRDSLRRWLVTERTRSAELEFLQSVRGRIKIAPVASPKTGDRAGASRAKEAARKGLGKSAFEGAFASMVELR